MTRRATPLHRNTLYPLLPLPRRALRILCVDLSLPLPPLLLLRYHLTTEPEIVEILQIFLPIFLRRPLLVDLEIRLMVPLLDLLLQMEMGHPQRGRHRLQVEKTMVALLKIPFELV